MALAALASSGVCSLIMATSTGLGGLYGSASFYIRAGKGQIAKGLISHPDPTVIVE